MEKKKRTFIERYIDIIHGCIIRCYEDARICGENDDVDDEMFYLIQCKGLLMALRALVEIGVNEHITEEGDIALRENINAFETAINQAHDTGYYAIFD